MSAVVGIDLGTTNSVVAAVQGGRAATLANERGERLIPSVVAFHPNGSVLVGNEAKARRLQDAANTVYSTKRLIGRSYGSAEVRRARARCSYAVTEGPGQGLLVVARGESYTLSEISAFVLRECKRVAEAALNDTVDRAVITVPANFNDLQRAATKVAGHIAGIDVLRILNEPTAAALAYGCGKGIQERIVVYDFGGGTFDVTLLDLAGNVFEVLATAGDTFLGGDDIDHAIADRMADGYLQKHRYDPRADRQVYERVLHAAEELKVELSTKESATVHLQQVAYGPGGKALDMPFSMSRTELDSLVEPLIGRTLKVCEDALSVARLKPDAFDQVVVVGGSTRIPAVRARVAEFFRKRPLDRLSADEVVALGAAIQATALSSPQRQRASGTITTVGPRGTDPGLGSVSGKGAGMIPAPVAPSDDAEGRPTLPQSPESDADDILTQVVSRDLLPASEMASPAEPTLMIAPQVAPQRGVRTAPGLASVRTEEEAGANRHGLTPPVNPSPTTAGMMAAPSLGPTAPPSKAPVPRPPATGQPTARMPSKTDAAPGQTTSKMPPCPPSQSPASKAGARLDQQSPRAQAAAAAAMAAAAAAAAATKLPSSRPAPAPNLPISRVEPPKPMAEPLVPALTPAPPPPRLHPAPLLLDVTPLSLAVETVNNYCDVIITRNTPIPCQRSRKFATAADNQAAVRINVAQGESERFNENTLLGQVELSGLRAASRGEVQIEVTFELDANGMLDVRASDTATGQSTSARIRLGGAIPGVDDLDKMRERVQRAI
ncbi:MAG: Hsp70 family protein [Polyangiaceae bacterium]|jgi:molecular chaperone DnaK|nr:Hsp70 family protein [Polyangiaceae bacterium]